jgi:hypothetical protein
VTEEQVVPDHEAAWQAIHAPEFDPARTVVLEQAGTRPSPQGTESEPASIAVTRYAINEVELDVEVDTSGWLVLSDVYYPGWRATIDGIVTPVLRADYAFRAVSVPPGEHVVHMTFNPWPWRLGLAITLLTWLGLAAAAARPR